MKYLPLLLLLTGCHNGPEADNGRIINKYQRINDRNFCTFWYQRSTNDEQDFVDSCSKYNVGDYISNAAAPSK